MIKLELVSLGSVVFCDCDSQSVESIRIKLAKMTSLGKSFLFAKSFDANLIIR